MPRKTSVAGKATTRTKAAPKARSSAKATAKKTTKKAAKKTVKKATRTSAKTTKAAPKAKAVSKTAKKATKAASKPRAKKKQQSEIGVTSPPGGSPLVDAYIANAPEFAKPSLRKIRALFHLGCPGIEESLKWSVPHFGSQGMVGSMAAFKNHITWGLWRAAELPSVGEILETVGNTQMGLQKLHEIDELPDDEIVAQLVSEAAELNDEEASGKRPKKKKPAPAKGRTVDTPAELAAALDQKKHAAAKVTWEGFSYSNRKEYVEWLGSAKQTATRAKRLTETLEWLAEGKPRNWKHMKQWK
jgi:hypothetical protein